MEGDTTLICCVPYFFKTRNVIIMKVKSIKQLREKILEQAKKGLEESKDEVKDIVHEESVRIYDEFESHAQFPYERRFDNNGFADEDNIKASGIKEKGNRVSYTVEN